MWRKVVPEPGEKWKTIVSLLPQSDFPGGLEGSDDARYVQNFVLYGVSALKQSGLASMRQSRACANSPTPDLLRTPIFPSSHTAERTLLSKNEILSRIVGVHSFPGCSGGYRVGDLRHGKGACCLWKAVACASKGFRVWFSRTGAFLRGRAAVSPKTRGGSP